MLEEENNRIEELKDNLEGIVVSEEDLGEIVSRYESRIDVASKHGGFHPKDVDLYSNPAAFMRRVIYAMAFSDKRLTLRELGKYTMEAPTVWNYSIRKEMSGKNSVMLRDLSHARLLELFVNKKFLKRYEESFSE